MNAKTPHLHTFKGMPDVNRGVLKGPMVNSVSGFLTALRKYRICSAAGDDGAVNVTARGSVMNESKDNDRVTVCDKCLQASCWQGVFMCWESRSAGTTEKTVAELRKLKLENESYWS